MNRSVLSLVGSAVFTGTSLAIPTAAFSIDAPGAFTQNVSQPLANNNGIKLSQNTEASFPDIPENHWASAFISRLAQLDIIQGYPDGSFQPNKVVTKAEFAAMVAKAFDMPDETGV